MFGKDMFFPERIQSIKDGDIILEVGPGGSPFHRSNILLEKRFSTESEAEAQRGYSKPLQTKKKIVYFDGARFPFKNQAFDYVICSHVLEHIPPDGIVFFLEELARVAPRGYLEFPTVYYDYIYNFPEHVTLLLNRNGTVNFIGKSECRLIDFSSVQRFFYESLVAGRNSMIQELRQYFFQGFEWEKKITCQKADGIANVVFTSSEINFNTDEAPINQHCDIIQKLSRWFK